MNQLRTLVLIISCSSLLLISACKMTDEQLRSVPPELLSEDVQFHTVQTQTEESTKIPYGMAFGIMALLAGVVLYLRSEAEPVRKGRKTSARRKKS